MERNAIVSSKIELHESSGGSTGPLLAPVLHNEEVRCRFTMCNPPFHQVIRLPDFSSFLIVYYEDFTFVRKKKMGLTISGNPAARRHRRR